MTTVLQHMKANGLLIALGAAAFVATLVAQAPASIIPALINLEGRGVGFASVDGTLWRGRIENLTYRNTPIGDVSYRVSPLSLLLLSPRLEASSTGGAVRGKASVQAGLGRRLEITDTALDIDLGPFAERGIMGRPVEGVAQITVARIAVSAAGCRAADARLWTDVLDEPVQRFRGTDFPMTGNVRCDGDDLVASMAGQNMDGLAQMTLRVRPNFSYELTARAEVAEDELASALRFFGFEDDNGALVYGSAGMLRGVGT